MHERLDALFGRFDLRDPDDYSRFLAAHAAALVPVEAALDRAGMADMLEDWPARRRADLMAADLAALGRVMPSPLALPALTDPAAAWGAAYVVEGSRLGGALLARSVDPALPSAYLATPLPAGSWRRLLEKLDAALYLDEMRASAIQSARHVFGMFEAAGRAVGAR